MKKHPELLRRVMIFFLAGVSTFLFSGCDGGQSVEATKITIESGDNQAAPVGSELKKELRIRVLGPKRKGLLGGKGKQLYAPGVKVRFEAVDKTKGPEVIGDAECVTDSGGFARVNVRLGNRFGDQYLKAYVVDETNKISTTFHFISGAEIINNKQETLSGNELPERFGLKLTGVDGKPLVGVPVYFDIAGYPGKKPGKLKAEKETDKDGLVLAELTTYKKASGAYKIFCEVSDPDRNIHLRGVQFKQMSFSKKGLLVAVLGGLAVFILGMKFMSDGLQRVAGERLKSILHFFTANRFFAVTAGAVVTGLIQSSSACTVMVVGFVNAGLLQLKQAIGIIYGANIGTTITGQMVSFKLNNLALPAIVVGVVMLLIGKKTFTKSMAQTIFGFGLLFLGMTMMSQELKAIAKFPTFETFFNRFDCTPAAGEMMPILKVFGAIAIGTLLTVVVQSSSATIGLTIALADSGLINFYTAVPLILGDNIGTTITAVLASIGANRTARQSALAHTMFNVVGALYMTLLFYVPLNGRPIFLYIVDNITSGDAFNGENVGRHIASAHTLFNVSNVLMFLPLVSMIAWICQKVVPVKNVDDEKVHQLEPHLLNTPTVALQQTIAALTKMTDRAWKAVDDSYKTILTQKISDRGEFREREDKIDKMQLKISSYLVDLTRRELTEEQAKVVPLIIHCVNDAERMGDRAENLLNVTDEMASSGVKFSDVAQKELEQMFELITKMASCVIDALNEKDMEDNIQRALKIEGEINFLAEQCHDNHVKRLGDGNCTVNSGILFVDVVSNLERIADHFSNIAERMKDISKHHVEI